MPNLESDFGFVILSPDHNFGLIRSTIGGLKNHYADKSITVAVSDTATKADIDEIKTICPNVHKGKKTVTSLINVGVKKGFKGWNMLLMEGSLIRKDIHRRIMYFMQGEKDILFPIVTDYDYQGKPIRIHGDIVDSTLNGFTIHQKTFKEVGDFSDNPMEISRLFWALAAVDKGCKFKGILGAKI